MYLHLGQSVVVPSKEVIGIFDMDTTTCAKSSRHCLEEAERSGQMVNVAEDLPKSFVLCQRDGQEPVIYLSQLSSATLKGRGEGNFFE